MGPVHTHGFKKNVPGRDAPQNTVFFVITQRMPVKPSSNSEEVENRPTGVPDKDRHRLKLNFGEGLWTESHLPGGLSVADLAQRTSDVGLQSRAADMSCSDLL